MEKIKEALALLKKNSETLSKDTSKTISVYGEGKVTAETLALCILTIKKAFPKLPIEWYDLMSLMIKEDNFTDARLIAATKNLIRTCIYPEPTIASLLNHDRVKKVYTNNEILEITKDFSPESRKRFYQNFTWDNNKKRYIENQ